ncbi:hypothetical protein Acr_07g0009370 [Actinidia rufa]|uniref:Uncharacterized protein n=1 Tax=Actinidia rufa TaxID=165716 RepID=A0A7J0EWH1_9ERIC|nr:hypothetical protein Acr_07g0009370 [Actinidia rufa]
MFLSLILTENVATPPPMSSPIRIVPGCFTASTSSMEKSSPPQMFGPAHRVYAVQITDESDGVDHRQAGRGRVPHILVERLGGSDTQSLRTSFWARDVKAWNSGGRSEVVVEMAMTGAVMVAAAAAVTATTEADGSGCVIGGWEGTGRSTLVKLSGDTP